MGGGGGGLGAEPHFAGGHLGSAQPLCPHPLEARGSRLELSALVEIFCRFSMKISHF